MIDKTVLKRGMAGRISSLRYPIMNIAYILNLTLHFQEDMPAL